MLHQLHGFVVERDGLIYSACVTRDLTLKVVSPGGDVTEHEGAWDAVASLRAGFQRLLDNPELQVVVGDWAVVRRVAPPAMLEEIRDGYDILLEESP